MILQLKLDANAFTPDRLRDALAAFVKTAVQPDPTAKITSAWYHRAPDGSIFQGGVVKNDNKKTKGVIDLGGELAPGTVPFSTPVGGMRSLGRWHRTGLHQCSQGGATRADQKHRLDRTKCRSRSRNCAPLYWLVCPWAVRRPKSGRSHGRQVRAPIIDVERYRRYVGAPDRLGPN